LTFCFFSVKRKEEINNCYFSVNACPERFREEKKSNKRKYKQIFKNIIIGFTLTMFKSRKYIVWLTSLFVFVFIVCLELFLKRENLYISELGVALGIISGTYQTSNIFQKKFTNDVNINNISLPKP